ncbi:exosortase/archaeosortase family protein [Modestobacter roseus]|uniref:Exosortase/archaeosortase family protein n=1 Tax=Modestobacter roseus TaxID=1181884 RepID=A0A562IXY1_9ACTN|nr:exosortase/archaeosortase family protein [Modestobacter roseus]MQA32754.1 hypothetical protein [Modestobacter roseus]TWH75746.1 exosortase/archaeosortase family protein [Modestobacter roseus]
MTTALGQPTPWSAPTAGSDDVGLVRPLLSIVAAGVMIGLFVVADRVQELEASLSAGLARLGGISDAARVGTSVLFSVDGVQTGYGITLGCTVAFLIIPFTGVTVVLLAVQRVSAWRALASLAAAIGTVFAVNQVRLLAIAEAMATFGPADGYARTHLLAGTLISTIGVVAAGTLYLAILLRGSASKGRHRA